MLLLGFRDPAVERGPEGMASSPSATVTDDPSRPSFCPRCGLTVAHGEELTPHRSNCSGTS